MDLVWQAENSDEILNGFGKVGAILGFEWI